MGALEQFSKAGRTDVHQTEAFGVDRLTFTWFKKAADGYHIDRSTNDEIGQMGSRHFNSIEAARLAVVQKANVLGIKENYLLFPQLTYKN
jgi:hypothetical protein